MIIVYYLFALALTICTYIFFRKKNNLYYFKAFFEAIFLVLGTVLINEGVENVFPKLFSFEATGYHMSASTYLMGFCLCLLNRLYFARKDLQKNK